VSVGRLHPTLAAGRLPRTPGRHRLGSRQARGAAGRRARPPQRVRLRRPRPLVEDHAGLPEGPHRARPITFTVAQQGELEPADDTAPVAAVAAAYCLGPPDHRGLAAMPWRSPPLAAMPCRASIVALRCRPSPVCRSPDWREAENSLQLVDRPVQTSEESRGR